MSQELEKELKKLRNLNANLHDKVKELEAEKEIKKNKNFVQLYKKELLELRALTASDPNAMSLLLLLVEKMNKQNAILMSQKTMMQITGKSRTTIHTALSVLKKSRFLQVVKVGTANAYVINSKVFWQGEADNKFAVFNATVVASASEQEGGETAYIENWKGIKLKQLPMFGETPIEAPEEE